MNKFALGAFLACGSFCVACAFFTRSVNAATFSYVCTGRAGTHLLKVDDAQNIIEWRGAIYKITETENCGRYGWRAEGVRDSFNFCTATQGYADFQQDGSDFQCSLQQQHEASAPKTERPFSLSSPSNDMTATRVLGVRMRVEVSNEAFPTIYGQTNFPDGTVLFVQLSKPWRQDAAKRLAANQPICGDTCAPAFSQTQHQPGEMITVQNGRFQAGPFAWTNNSPLAAGEYIVDILLGSMPNEPKDTSHTSWDIWRIRYAKPIYSIAVDLHVTR